MLVTALVGSARKKFTYDCVKKYMDNLKSFGDVETEIVFLSDYRLKPCLGCKVCFEKGEEFCPLQDDRDILIQKLKDSDGLIIATPNYTFQVSGLTKLFLDRLGYIMHRPSLFGKTYTNLVVQGIYGGKNLVNYLNFIGPPMGYNLVKGICFTSLEPTPQKVEEKINKKILAHSQRFYRQLIKRERKKPSLFELMIFRMSRSGIKTLLDDKSRDYRYYREMGWFESDFYYPTKIGLVKKVLGRLFDLISASSSK